ncbi:MAG: ribonuclease P protein component [OM182 bacterium]|nr:MAG: ribonuclease P protein component [OM182 bacterium]
MITSGKSFPPRYRLLSQPQFSQVFANAQIRKRSGNLRLHALKNKEDTARLGLAVPKRGTPKAHRRNRLKRLIRETFRVEREKLPSIDIVVQVSGPIDDSQLRKDLRDQLESLAKNSEYSIQH